MTKLKIAYKDPATLIPYENNPRVNDSTVPYLMNSIADYGFLIPVVVDKDGVIITGHTRVKAAMELGLKEVPTVCAADLTPAQADEFRLIDNKVQELSYWDRDKLKAEMSRLNLDWQNYGFEPMPTFEPMEVWSEPEEPAAEDAEAVPDSRTYSHVEGGCRILATLPEGMEPDAIIEMLEYEGCRVKLLD